MAETVIRVIKKHYPQTLLEECIYEIKESKMENFLNDVIDPSSSDNETDNFLLPNDQNLKGAPNGNRTCQVYQLI